MGLFSTTQTRIVEMAIGANKVEIEAYLAERGARDEKKKRRLLRIYCSSSSTRSSRDRKTLIGKFVPRDVKHIILQQLRDKPAGLALQISARKLVTV